MSSRGSTPRLSLCPMTDEVPVRPIFSAYALYKMHQRGQSLLRSLDRNPRSLSVDAVRAVLLDQLLCLGPQRFEEPTNVHPLSWKKGEPFVSYCTMGEGCDRRCGFWFVLCVPTQPSRSNLRQHRSLHEPLFHDWREGCSWQCFSAHHFDKQTSIHWQTSESGFGDNGSESRICQPVHHVNRDALAFHVALGSVLVEQWSGIMLVHDVEPFS